MTAPMKDQLATLIEAYAAARASNNAVLQQFAAYQLQQFLDTADVVALDSGEDEPKTP